MAGRPARVPRLGFVVVLLFPCLVFPCLVPTLGCGADWEGGIHARMGHSPTQGLRVVEVPPDGPAARAGLAAGDLIVAIDGEPVEGAPPEAIAERLRGEVGSTVQLRIDRAGRLLTLEVERAPYAD